MRIQRKRGFSLSLLLLAFAFAVSCVDHTEPTSWPPNTDKVHAEFLAEKESFLYLQSKFEGSLYLSVYLNHDGEPRALVEREGKRVWELPEDPTEWSEVMKRIGVTIAFRNEYCFSLITDPVTVDKSRLQMTAYVLNYADTVDIYKRCSSRFQELKCGTCEQFRHERWSVAVTWTPDDLLGFADEGELHECFVEGFQKLGYDDDLLPSIE